MNILTTEEIKRINAIPMNFLVGKERSGTTLLQLLLNTHPNITAPPESRFMMLLYSRYGKIKKWTDKDLQNFCNDLFGEKSFKNFWTVDKTALTASIHAAKEIATYPLLCKIVFYYASPEKDVKMFFDKNPIHCYFLPKLKELFPEAKYIHIVRDYRANIVSHRRVFVVKQSADIAYRWLKMNMLIEKAKELAPGQYFTLKYEELVANPAKYMDAVCRFLQIPIYENMEWEHSKNIYPSYNANSKAHFRAVHDKIFKPLTNIFANEWQEKLSSADILRAEKIAGEYGKKTYGYAITDTNQRNENSAFSRFIVALKYRGINSIYMLALRNPRLYSAITKYVWKNF